MDSIRITSTPPGQAPEKIRQQWIGVVIPLLPGQEVTGRQVGVQGGEAQNTGGYKVNPRTAIEQLRKSSARAAEWWDGNFPVDTASAFVFKKECYELVRE